MIYLVEKVAKPAKMMTKKSSKDRAKTVWRLALKAFWIVPT
jgi:hypothetical protein